MSPTSGTGVQIDYRRASESFDRNAKAGYSRVGHVDLTFTHDNDATTVTVAGSIVSFIDVP